ncbi:hypothetical protein EMIT074MI3_30108 [Bacillus licheniformis]
MLQETAVISKSKNFLINILIRKLFRKFFLRSSFSLKKTNCTIESYTLSVQILNDACKNIEYSTSIFILTDLHIFSVQLSLNLQVNVFFHGSSLYCYVNESGGKSMVYYLFFYSCIKNKKYPVHYSL